MWNRFNCIFWWRTITFKIQLRLIYWLTIFWSLHFRYWSILKQWTIHLIFLTTLCPQFALKMTACTGSSLVQLTHRQYRIIRILPLNFNKCTKSIKIKSMNSLIILTYLFTKQIWQPNFLAFKHDHWNRYISTRWIHKIFVFKKTSLRVFLI